MKTLTKWIALLCLGLGFGYHAAALPSQSLEIGKTISAKIPTEKVLTYSLKITQESGYKISLTKAKSDLTWWITSDPEDGKLSIQCDNNLRAGNDEICNVYLQPGDYLLYVSEQDEVDSSFDLLVDYNPDYKVYPIVFGQNYHQDSSLDAPLFKISVPQNGFYIISVRNQNSSTYARIYDSNFKPVAFCYYMNDNNIECPLFLKTSAYYINFITDDAKTRPSFDLTVTSDLNPPSLKDEEKLESVVGPERYKLYKLEVIAKGLYQVAFTEQIKSQIDGNIFDMKGQQMGFKERDGHIRSCFTPDSKTSLANFCTLILEPGTYFLNFINYNLTEEPYFLYFHKLETISYVELGKSYALTMIENEFQVFDLQINSTGSSIFSTTGYIDNDSYPVGIILLDDQSNILKPIATNNLGAQKFNLEVGHYRVILRNNLVPRKLVLVLNSN